MARTKLRRARRAVKAVKNDIYSDLYKIKNALYDATSNVSDKAGDLLTHRLSDLQDRTTDIEANVVDYVIDKPIKSIGFAILAGVFFGLYLRK